MKLILVGAGGTARELLRRLGEIWDVTVVTPSGTDLRQADRARPFSRVEGDGSSRLTLVRAGLDEADAVVAAAADDEVNLEVCRLAREAGVARVIAVANDPEGVDDFRRIGVSAVQPASLSARRVEIELETRRVASMAFADGRAEAAEFRIKPDSLVCGRALRELHARSWIVGAILREGSLIIPHGDTVLRAGDLVTVVGAGTDFGEIVRTFTSGEGRFPLDFGKRVAVALGEERELGPAFAEAVHVCRNTKAASLVVVHRDPATLRDDSRAGAVEKLLSEAKTASMGVELRTRPVRNGPLRALAALPAAESVGLIVIHLTPGRGPLTWLRAGRAAALARRTGRPVLLARGSHPYRTILVPARRTPAGRAAARAAIDLASFVKAELVSPVVVDPVFLSGNDEVSTEKRVISWLQEEAAIQGVSVHGSVIRGNPVRTLRDQGERADLLVLGLGPRRRRFTLGTGVAEFVAGGSSRSVLLVPSRESTLA